MSPPPAGTLRRTTTTGRAAAAASSAGISTEQDPLGPTGTTRADAEPTTARDPAAGSDRSADTPADPAPALSDGPAAVPRTGPQGLIPRADELLPVEATSPPVRVTPLGVVVLAVVSVTMLAAFVGALLRAARTEQPDPAQALSTKVTVGPQGGTVAFPGGSIEVPPGAVDREIAIVVRQIPFDRVRGAVRARTETVWELGPQDVTFDVPVRVVFPIPKPDRPAEVFVVSEGTVRPLDAAPDADARTVSVLTYDLAFRRLEPQPLPGVPQGEA